MNDFSRHIEHLLLTHDCVVVPLFGAFVARRSESTRVEQENLFFPPLRTVRFNPDVTEDDGLLVEAVRTANRSTLPEAKRAVQGMVLRLRQQLLADGQVDFGSIGVFTQDEDGHLAFSSCQAGATTPDYYGLDAFYMPRLAATTATDRRERHRQQLRQREAEDERDTIVIRLSRRVLHHTAALAAAAVLVACVLFTMPADLLRQKRSQLASLLPVKNENVDIKGKEGLATTPSLSKTGDKEMVNSKEVGEKGDVSENVIVDSHPSTNNHQSLPLPPTDEVKEAPNYAIILASSIGRRNAERFIGELSEKGIHAHIYEKGKMLRVVVDGFATETDAYNEARQIKSMGGELKDAWVMRL